jgi:hypothetical protein
VAESAKFLALIRMDLLAPRMLDLSDALRDMKVTPPRPAPKKTFSMRRLQQLGLWGAAATAALLIAVITSQGEIGSQRIATILHLGRQQAPAHGFDAEAETRRLGEALHSLATDNDGIKTRLKALERNIGDITGSITREAEATKASSDRHEFEDGPTIQAAAAVAASLPSLDGGSWSAAAPATPATAAPGNVSGSGSGSSPAPSPAPAAAQSSSEYGVDIGSGLTIQALRARWLAIRSAHPQLFEGLQPIVSVKEAGHGNRLELRLIAGPLTQSGAAADLCSALTPYGLYCQPTLYDGQRLALR